jgi:hypothetical protein
MTLPPKPDSSSVASEPDPEVGYKRPPKKWQFKKGQSGNLRGRPKTPPFSLDIKSILDGVQQGKNGEAIPKREALAHRIVSDALAGNQKSFRRFLDLLELSGLKKSTHDETANGVVTVKSRPMTEAEKAFWQPDRKTPKRESD